MLASDHCQLIAIFCNAGFSTQIPGPEGGDSRYCTRCGLASFPTKNLNTPFFFDIGI